MTEKFLYDKLFEEFGRRHIKDIEVPKAITGNLNQMFELRPYQTEAFQRFLCYYQNNFDFKERPIHLAFNMATGSGKTLIMAGLILYLYTRGFRNFLFFVHSTNIIEKTKDNFLNPSSMKYLLDESIVIDDKRVQVSPVVNFEGVNSNDINICFTTDQKLHSDLRSEKENSITFEDFRDKRIVLIADEAHHIQAKTKRNNNKKLDLGERTWEDTIERIHQQNEDNILLEFTATLDYTHKNIVDKYRNKVLYRYDLREFRNDGYSKDVFIVQSDFHDTDRILQALILSQYKQEVAAEHRLNLKPVILLKAHRTIAQSKENKTRFHQLIDNLTADDIEKIRKKSNIDLLQQAFRFFDDNKISSEHLVKRLKVEFAESRCLSVNEEKEKENYQLLLNSLEERDNHIRAVFAVQKLNEGWDVLNLFDIVRCYEARDSKWSVPGRTTISEAQLIGRGARYFPFATEEFPDLFRRKYDADLNNELRVLEELHYHSVNDSRYISELRTALIKEGMIDEREVERKLKLKDSFKETDFYKDGIIYINERVINDFKDIKSISDMGVKKRNYLHKIATGRGATGALLDEKEKVAVIPEAKQKDVPVKNIERHIIQNALSRNPFYTFRSLNHYFPHLRTSIEFIESVDYLAGLEITFQGDPKQLEDLPNVEKLEAISGLLAQIEAEVKQNITEFIGTEKFKPNSIAQVFHDKTLKLLKDSERAKGDEGFVKEKEWYVFNANYGTTEEKAFVRMLDRQIEKLRQDHDGIYLIRNERHFKIRNFSDGQAFEPDFVLFLKEKNGDLLTYQLFIEPKGKHLKPHDQWKEKFLQEIKERFGEKTLEFSPKRKYRIIGVPFYNNEEENEFKATLFEALNIQ